MYINKIWIMYADEKRSGSSLFQCVMHLSNKFCSIIHSLNNLISMYRKLFFHFCAARANEWARVAMNYYHRFYTCGRSVCVLYGINALHNLNSDNVLHNSKTCCKVFRSDFQMYDFMKPWWWAYNHLLSSLSEIKKEVKMLHNLWK